MSEQFQNQMLKS